MKRIFARISMELIVSDDEADQILNECNADWYTDSCTHQKCNNEFDLTEDLAQRFLKEGTYSEHSSYVPEDCITEA